MTTPSSTPDPDAIIATDADARELLSTLLGPALRRQLWAFLLASNGRQLPIVIPIDGIPASPSDEELRSIVSSLGQVLDEYGPGGSILFALERPGDETPHGFDELWADGLHSAAEDEAVDVFAIYLVHDDGLRMMKARLSARR
ncbi:MULTISPECIES: hypothetical protein [unclassified Agreia]|uniref:hypothetical protein n=1 Tax=unclassified Agreia TaxID=2641148 RepID=UPI0006FFCD14|nr:MULTISPECIES: hypothetical protein [Microbacteriaceae]KQM58449.1 hypothetical protein ASE64_13235 [Agreia sp. Leaf210]KQR22052.1 hypothetical protein ASF79_07010 [Agreia sp. Leaf335]PPF64444.1 hypothetical protein C5E11_03320 [Clavibacter michiganensis]